MGKVLVLAAGEQERWNMNVPKQIIPVFDAEPLIARTVRQVRQRMNNYPHIVSHQKCLRPYSTNYIIPSSHRWICETLLSVAPIWGKDWTMVLLGDVIYTDGFMDTLYNHREKYHYHFYGTTSEIYGLTFTSNAVVEKALMEVVDDAAANRSRGKLWELYYCLSQKPLPDAGKGYTGGDDDLHYTYILDGSTDFDTQESYKEWTRQHILNK